MAASEPHGVAMADQRVAQYVNDAGLLLHLSNAGAHRKQQKWRIRSRELA